MSGHDLLICFAYIPPHDLNWFKSGQSLNFDKILEGSAEFEKVGNCLLVGDFNGRTSNNNNFIYDEEFDNFLPRDENYIPDNI